jgi:hypothetical protein
MNGHDRSPVRRNMMSTSTIGTWRSACEGQERMVFGKNIKRLVNQ